MEQSTVQNHSSSDTAIIAKAVSEISLFQAPNSIQPCGASAWADSYKISLANGRNDDEAFFMKISFGDHGRKALKGEFESTSALHAVQGDFVPKPIAHGSFKSLPNAHYYICKFYDLDVDAPKSALFCKKIAAVHRNSQSPNGKFGFHVVTYNGNIPQDNTYTDTWEEFFANGLKHMIDLNLDRGGPWPEIEVLRTDMLKKVIPRLLRPLETNGRTVKPCLVHGDLWCGNAAVDQRTDLPLIYDPSSFYAHNEYELGNWRPERNKFKPKHFQVYHGEIGKSKPEEDYDDRIILYSIRFNLHAAAMFSRRSDMPNFREMVVDDMRDLIAKYPKGYQEQASRSFSVGRREGSLL